MQHVKARGFAIDCPAKRNALIGFDYAIEFSTEVFKTLRPKLRNGIQFQTNDVEKARRNYHTEIEWLDEYVEQNELQVTIFIDEVVWHQSLRIELYHSGIGIVPEMHVLDGVRRAAIATINALFSVDAASCLASKT